MEKPNHRHWLLLRQGREWPSDRTASNSPNEISPPHGCPPRPTRRYLRLKHSRGDDSSKGAITPLTMSALGQKRTCAVQNAMSALPPIATAKANFRTRSCPLYTRKRTCALH